MEESRNEVRNDKDSQKSNLGKRSFGSYVNKNFEAGDNSGFNKKPMYGKQPHQCQGQEKSQLGSNASEQKRYDRCLGPQSIQECKWTPGACFACGKLGHKVNECKNSVLKNVFYYNYGQRGHLYSECKEKKDESKKFGNGKEKAGA